MKLNFSNSVWKNVLLALNTLISMLGVLLISCGVVALGGMGSMAGAYGITVLGSLILGICFLGCFASLRESFVLSVIFVVTVAVGIALQMVFMVALLVAKDVFVEMGEQRIARLWEEELTKPGAMATVHYLYSCCGKDGPQDYLKDADDVLPASCCLHNDCSDSANMYAKGCTVNIVNFFDAHSMNMILLSLGLVVVEVLSLMAAYYLAKGVQNRTTKATQNTVSE